MAEDRNGSYDFDVWGCRGSRNLVPARSGIGNRTSCYSVLVGTREPILFVLDAGRGIAALGYAMLGEARFSAVKTVHVLVTHAHMDHWEGLKDVEWFWQRGNGLDLTIHGTAEALAAIREAFEPPAYVALEKLAEGTVSSLRFQRRAAGGSWRDAGVSVSAFALHHYSGSGDTKRYVDTIGYRLEVDGGPVFAYLSDHEPTESTLATETAVTKGAHAVVYDCHFLDVKDHAFGHGSQEYGAEVARRLPAAAVFAGHLSPNLSDDTIREAYARLASGLPNFHLAVEGESFTWDAPSARFVRRA
jgi:phosphoribosyl 1,2-cyclic phosphodiesterase